MESALATIAHPEVGKLPCRECGVRRLGRDRARSTAPPARRESVRAADLVGQARRRAWPEHRCAASVPVARGPARSRARRYITRRGARSLPMTIRHGSRRHAVTGRAHQPADTIKIHARAAVRGGGRAGDEPLPRVARSGHNGADCVLSASDDHGQEQALYRASRHAGSRGCALAERGFCWLQPPADGGSPHVRSQGLRAGHFTGRAVPARGRWFVHLLGRWSRAGRRSPISGARAPAAGAQADRQPSGTGILVCATTPRRPHLQPHFQCHGMQRLGTTRDS